jgi:hypothetical protein
VSVVTSEQRAALLRLRLLRRQGAATQMRPDELQRRLRARLDALGPAPRAELLHVLMLPDSERADRIGELWSYPQRPHFRRAADRLRGGSDASGSTRRHVERGGLSPGSRVTSYVRR